MDRRALRAIVNGAVHGDSALVSADLLVAAICRVAQYLGRPHLPQVVRSLSQESPSRGCAYHERAQCPCVDGWVSRGWLGLGCLGEPGVQLFSDFLRGIGAAAALIAGDRHPGSGYACKGRQSQHFPPAHLLRLDRAHREPHLG
jgi:hypothetical protein